MSYQITIINRRDELFISSLMVGYKQRHFVWLNSDVNRSIQFYNLDAVISVGYRVNSIRATQFRQWATSVLRQYAIRGYVTEVDALLEGMKHTSV